MSCYGLVKFLFDLVPVAAGSFVMPLPCLPSSCLSKLKKNPDWTSNKKKRFLEGAEKEGEASRRHRSLAGRTPILGETNGDLNFSTPEPGEKFPSATEDKDSTQRAFFFTKL